MTFTTEERRLFTLFYSGSVKTVILAVLDALPDIDEPDVHAAAVSLLERLGSMSDDECNILVLESEVCYVG